MKRAAWFLLSVFILVSGLYAEGIRDISGRSELILLHTNDLHGTILPNNGWGGLAEISAFVKAVRADNSNVLLLDAGDFNTGSALSNMFNAEPDILALNIMRYDAVTFGNHEFDGTMEKLNNQISLAAFPFVSSNIKTSNGNFLGGNQYIIKRYNNFTVGIFGLTTLRTRVIASPDRSLVFINELEAAREVINILRNEENVDIVIGLTHMGDVKESEDHITSIKLAKEVEGIDIIIDGHSHTFFTEPRRAGDTWVVSANEWGKYVGFGRLTIQNGELVDFYWVPVAMEPVPEAFASVYGGPDPEVTEMLAPYIEKANDALKEVIGEAEDTFIFGNRLTRYQETAIGNMITDANVWFFKNEQNMELDFAFHNGGNIRAELPRGPITQEQILTILPFENYLHVVSMTGSQLTELFDFIATIPQGNGGFPQFSSEVRYTIDKTSGAGIISNLTIGGASIDPNRIYRFCTNDYILGGGDGYAAMTNAVEPFNASILLSYVVTEYIRAQQTIRPVLDGRLTIIGGVEQ